MLKQIARLKVGLGFILGILFFCSTASAMVVREQDNSRDNREGNRGYHRGYNREQNREERHYYRNGRWYKRDSRGNEIAVSVLSIGALIDSLPPRHETVVVQDTKYYHDDSHYYRQRPEGGYVVVVPPVIVQPRSQSNYDNRREGDNIWHSEENRGENY